MKGLIAVIFCLLAISANASEGINGRPLAAIKLESGELIGNLSLEESDKVLESLDLDENIEIRERVIYPEEVSRLIVKKLTKLRLTEKKPNQGDYN
jgi:hypothetical protein